MPAECGRNATAAQAAQHDQRLPRVAAFAFTIDQTNPHSPDRDRVNGVVSNMPEYQKVFARRADAPMVRRNQCRVW